MDVRTDGRTDNELVTAARLGDRDAFTTLFQRHWRGLVAATRRHVRDVHRAQDLAQEAFVRLHQSLWQLEGCADVFGWLRRVSQNLAVDHARRRETRSEHELVEPESVVDAPPILPAEGSVAETPEPVWGAMTRLTRYESSLLFLRFARGLSYRDIARECGISIAAVKVAVHRGRQRLHRAMGA
ncbi:MAG: RNA polymerase sigma factor [Planctomycetes bacterium]|nr:RNA polymerase sigma factor [Planctomycetota bacterium]